MARLLLALLLLCAAAVRARTPICDIEAARSYCDSHPESPVGIWTIPGDNVKVLIHPADDGSPSFILTAVDSENGAVPPGTDIGTLTPTPDPKAFLLVLFRTPGKPEGSKRKLAAHIIDKGTAMTVEKGSFDIHFFPLRVLPYLGRTISVSYKNPVRQLPKGFIREYPAHDSQSTPIRF